MGDRSGSRFSFDALKTVRQMSSVKLAKSTSNRRSLTVFRGIRYRCQFTNPKGIGSFSPGLRGTSYPGSMAKTIPTLKGLNQTRPLPILTPCRNRWPRFWFTRVGLIQPFQGCGLRTQLPRVCLSESANPGLNDSIPLGWMVRSP